MPYGFDTSMFPMDVLEKTFEPRLTTNVVRRPVNAPEAMSNIVTLKNTVTAYDLLV
jgi:hypothetical protein